MKTYEIMNPSDHLTVQADHYLAAAIPVLLLGQGKLGLREVSTGETILPLMLFGGFDDWLRENDFADANALWAWVADHWRESVAVMESVVVGSGDTRTLLELELERIEGAEARRQHRIAFNDARRTSLNDIASTLMENAKRFREFYEAQEAAKTTTTPSTRAGR